MSNISALSTWFQKKTTIIGMIVALVVLAISIRMYKLTDLMIFTYDQGRDMYVLQQIARGDIKLMGPTTGLPGVFLGPFFYYALLPGYFLSNGSPFGVVIWQMVMITLALPLSYLVLKPMVGTRWALIGMLMLVLAPASIEEARSMWNPSWTVALLLICVSSLWQSLKNEWWLAVTALAFGLCLQTELAYVVFLAPIFGIWVLTRLSWSFRPQPGKYSWRAILVALGLFAATLIPQILFELKYDFLITNSVLREMGDATKQVTLAKVWEERPLQMAQELVRSTLGTTDNFKWLFLPMLLLWLWTGTRLGKNPQKKLVWWLFATPLFGFMMHRGNYGYFFNYYLSPHYALSIFVTILGLSELAKTRFTRWIPLVVIVGYSALFLRYASVNFDVPRFEYTAALQIKALLAARVTATTPETPLEVFVPNLVPVSYQYLSEWLSRTGQTRPMDFGLKGQKQYILVYEPPISDGSRVAFKEWYTGHINEATCTQKQTFGITTIELCQR